VRKQNEEKDGVTSDPIGKRNGIITFDEEELESVCHYTYKLNLTILKKLGYLFQTTDELFIRHTNWMVVRYFFQGTIAFE